MTKYEEYTFAGNFSLTHVRFYTHDVLSEERSIVREKVKEIIHQIFYFFKVAAGACYYLSK